MNLYRHLIVRPFLFFKGDRRLKILKELRKNEQMDYQSMSAYQLGRIIEVLRSSYENIPFYKDWFDTHQVDVYSITNWEDFRNKVPVLTKKDIMENIEKFEVISKERYFVRTTGGSTGEPLRYKFTTKDSQLGEAIFLRGLSYGGYSFGDRLVSFGGGSLMSSHKKKWTTKLTEKIVRRYGFSSYGINDNELNDILLFIKSKRIKFIRGYVSSVFLLADYAKQNGIDISLQSVFLTSEMLHDNQRQVIESVFKCKVYDNYGLNDGGISAYEWNGYGKVVDMERAYMEIENNGKAESRILATQFFNDIFPFIRYDTGDIGEISYDYVNEYPFRPRLIKLLGRQTEYLIINDKKIGSPVLTVLMGKVNVEQYKIVQTDKDRVKIQIKKSEKWTSEDEKFIRQSFFDKCGEFNLEFVYVDVFVNENKHKFIVREWKEESTI